MKLFGNLTIGVTILGWMQIAFGQLYGTYNCGNGNNNYCGPNPPTCTAAQNAAALQAFQGYYTNLGNSANNYAASTAYTTGNGNGAGIPPFQFNWYGSPSLIPIAGSYSGSNALSQFFTLVNANVKDFTYNTLFEPNNAGVLIPAYNCQFLVAQWQEMSTAIATDKAITYATNTVRYTFLNYSTPLIAMADVFVNDGQYQNAFCPGQVNCDGYSSGDDDGNYTEKTTLGLSIAILAAILVIAIVHFAVTLSQLYNKPKLSNAANSSGNNL
jgi:hypothetical protein